MDSPWSPVIGVLHLLARTFGFAKPEARSGQPNENDAAAIGKQVIDATARNALLEIHFGELKHRRPRRLTAVRTG